MRIFHTSLAGGRLLLAKSAKLAADNKAKPSRGSWYNVALIAFDLYVVIGMWRHKGFILVSAEELG